MLNLRKHKSIQQITARDGYLRLIVAFGDSHRHVPRLLRFFREVITDSQLDQQADPTTGFPLDFSDSLNWVLLASPLR